MEVCNTIQEAANKTILKKKKSKKAKWLSEEALQIAEERREEESKGEQERYIQLNAKFQRIAQRDKKAFFNEQCIKLEENNRQGKIRDLFRKTGNIKGLFCPNMGTMKDRNGRDLVDAKELKKRWKNTQQNCIKKILMNWITMSNPLIQLDWMSYKPFLESRKAGEKSTTSDMRMIPL